MSTYALAYVEWNSRGKVVRILRVHRVPPTVSAPDRIATALREGWVPNHRFDEFDVNWCERDQTYYIHEPGGTHGRIYLNGHVDGHRSKIWAPDDIEFCRADGDDRELTPEAIYELGYDQIELAEAPEDLSQTCEDQSCYWCGPCDDMLPENDECKHVYWCDMCGCLIEKVHKCEHFCVDHDRVFDRCEWDHDPDEVIALMSS